MTAYPTTMAAQKLSPDGLRYAMSVAETGSFSSAARAHGITQPALSNAIARLEGQLGARLFERSTSGATLTPFARDMLPLIERSVRSLDALASEATRLTAHARQTVRIGVSPIINAQLVEAAYRAAQRRDSPAGRRDAVLREANLDELRHGLATGDLDVILIPSVGSIPRFEHRVIGSERMVVIGARLRGPAEAALALAELQDTPLILVTDACGLTTFTNELFAVNGHVLRKYPGEASSYRVLEDWARMGVGAAVLPESKVAQLSDARQLLHDDGGDVEIFYQVVWDPASSLATGFSELSDVLAARSESLSATRSP